jgi:hypothetical protein
MGIRQRFTLFTLIIPVILLIAVLLAATGSLFAQSLRCVEESNRINNQPPRDCGAPVAIYLRGDTIAILATGGATNPEQTMVQVSKNTPIPTGSNLVIGEGTNPFTSKSVILSRLTTGEYQVNTFYPDNTPYIVVWYTGAEDLYHIDPETGQPLDGATPIIAPGANPGLPAPAVTTTETTTSLTESTAATTSPVSVQNCRLTTTRMVRIRTEPNTTSEIIATLPWRTSYQVTEILPEWYRVVYLDRQGWVNAAFVNTSGCPE